MKHSGNCETATTSKCVCPCGGARHRAILTKGIATSDPSVQDKAIVWAQPRRWTRLSAESRETTIHHKIEDRRKVITGIVSELAITLIEQARDDKEIDAIKALASKISDEVSAELQRHLASGRPDNSGNRHLWCVVLATICRLYEEGFKFVESRADKLAEKVIERLREGVSSVRDEKTRELDIYQHKYLVVAAFDLAEYPFLTALIKQALKAVIAAVKSIGEESVFKHLRLIGAITCPDIDRHPDVIKYCLWPLLSGPFKETLNESLEVEMRTWLCNACPVVAITGYSRLSVVPC